MLEATVHQCGRTTITDKWNINYSLISNKLYYINSGYLYCDDFKMTQGNIYIINDNAKHKWTIGKEFDHLHFDFTITPKLLGDDIIAIPIDKHPHLAAFIDACNMFFSDKEHTGNNDFNNSMVLSLLHLCNEIVPIFHHPDNSISKVISLIKYSETTPSVHTLADIAHLEVSYFIKKFKKETGMTPYQFINNFRLDQAYADLNEKMSVAEVAFKYGFSSESSFSNAFKKKFGIRPSYIQK